jgi:hypothetical protein
MSDVEIEESDGEIDLERSAFMFFGPPKIGKSTVASGWPNCVFLCTSKKEVKALKVPFILVNTHKKLVDAVEYLVENKKKLGYQTIVCDFLDAMWTNCIIYICKKLKIEHPSEAGYGKGVDMIDLEFKKLITTLIGSSYGCVFISHFQVKDVTTMSGVVQKISSTLPERARKIVIPLVSVIGFIDFKTVKIKDEVTKKVTFKKKRIISFEPSEFLEAGDRDGFLPDEIPCYRDPHKTYALIESYYNGERKKDE